MAKGTYGNSKNNLKTSVTWNRIIIIFYKNEKIQPK